MRGCKWVALLAVAVAVMYGTPAGAQLEDNLGAYTDDTAKGYLKPLQEAFGQALNSNFFTTAAIPLSGFRARLEVRAMSVMFKDEDDFFNATTGGDFAPEQTVEAPTAVGPGESVVVPGDGGTAYVFPGGFDLKSFTLGVPQLTIGGVAGTEAMVRWVAVDLGDSDFGKLSLLGLGLRHSLSQHLAAPPLDLAVAGYYQTFSVGDDFIDSKAYSVGLQASKNFGMLVPYGGLAYDMSSMTVQYTATSGAEDREVELDMDSDSTLHLTLGLGLQLGVLHLNASGELAKRTGFSAGVGFGF
jgi:hypothetical protein